MCATFVSFPELNGASALKIMHHDATSGYSVQRSTHLLRSTAVPLVPSSHGAHPMLNDRDAHVGRGAGSAIMAPFTLAQPIRGLLFTVLNVVTMSLTGPP
jgi:hypothetical protein